MCKNLIYQHPGLQLGGMPISTAIQSDWATIQEYVEYELLPCGLEAKAVTLILAAIALRHPIRIVVVDVESIIDVCPSSSIRRASPQ